MNTFESVVEEIPVRRKWYQFRQPNTTAIVKNVRVKILDYTNKKHVIAYMRAWAEILTEEGSMDCHSYEQESTETSQAQLTHTNKQSNENQIQTTNAQ